LPRYLVSERAKSPTLTPMGKSLGSSSDRPSELPQGQMGKDDDSPPQLSPQLHDQDAAGRAEVQGVNAESGVFELATARKKRSRRRFAGGFRQA
jgi:hypothetical protein